MQDTATPTSGGDREPSEQHPSSEQASAGGPDHRGPDAANEPHVTGEPEVADESEGAGEPEEPAEDEAVMTFQGTLLVSVRSAADSEADHPDPEPARQPSGDSEPAAEQSPSSRPTPGHATPGTPTPGHATPGHATPSNATPGKPSSGRTGDNAAEPVAEPTVDQVAAAAAFGRVAEDGTVLVRTRTGDRAVGTWAPGETEAAVAFFARRFLALQAEVSLAETRIRAGSLSAEAASQNVRRLRETVETAQAVGDLDDLAVRVDALDGLIAVARERRRAERAAEVAAAREQKLALVADAEQVAAGQNWRVGPERLRALFDQWKVLPRLDRPTDDELWKRFSAARTTYTRRRRAHYAELTASRDTVRAAKQTLIEEAETLRGSTEWGPTTAKHRELMDRWRAAGSAAKDVDDALWERFRAARQAFFDAREAHDAERSGTEKANLTAKQTLLTEAEGLLPVSDMKAARRAMRGIRERWEAIGHVPRSAVGAIDARLRVVDEALRRTEQHEWRRTDPEARRRAERTAEQLRPAITRLERELAAARERSDQRALREAQEALTARRQWLAQAEKIIAEAG